ncbi:MFS transporter, partial [Enterococcus hirae]
MTPNPKILITTHIILNLTINITSYTTPLYLSKITPKKIHNNIISLYQLIITINILNTYLSNT